MVKYCSDCDEIYYDEFNYCPMCSAKLEEVDEDIFQIKELIKMHSSEEDLFKIDEENKLLKFKWNGRWISESIKGIIQHYNVNYEPFTPPCFIEICSYKEKWDNLLKNNLPDYKKKLTYNQVGYCINAFISTSLNNCKIMPIFITSPIIADLDAENIFKALNEYGLIYNFVEIKLIKKF